MPARRLLSFLAILGLAAAFSIPPGLGLAQTAPVVWSEASNISNMSTDSAHPTILADAFGGVHVFWSENYPEYGTFNNVIYYARLEDGVWSQPVSILISPEDYRGMADEPAVVVGSDNKLHLVFVGGQNAHIYYSSAPIDQANNPRAWSQPVPLSQDAKNCGNPNIELDPQGNLRVVYQSALGQSQGIYHLQSSDNGMSWTFPARIPGVTSGANILLGDTRMAVAPDGNLHIAWMWTSATEIFPPKGIKYIHSNDADGKTWSNPQTIVEGPYRYPDLALDGNSNLHLVWSGTAPDRYKFSRWSPDGGQTWSPIIRMEQLGGFQGYSGMAVDSLGRINLGMVGSYFTIGDSLVHRIWDGKSWTEPEALLVNSVRENNLQYADIAISQGNIAHLVVMYPIYLSPGEIQNGGKSYQFEIYYVRGQLDTPYIQPLSTSIPDSSVTPTPTENSLSGKPTSAFATEQVQPILTTATSELNLATSTTIILAIVPVLFLLSVVIIVQKWK
jgi:hypothetical protein